MKHISIESAKRWEKLGIGKDSEYVWAKHRLFVNIAIEKRSVTVMNSYMDIIGPAMVSDEMEIYLIQKELMVSFMSIDTWAIRNTGTQYLESIKAKNPTEAREKAINWHLDQKEK